MPELAYQEQQSFRYRWSYWLCLILTLLFVYGCWQQLLLQQPFGSKPAPDLLLLLLSLLMLTLLAALHFSSLELQLNEHGLAVRFLPLLNTWRRHHWQEINSVKVISYSPIAEFGGWGIRGNKNYRCYSISGNQGLKVQLKTGRVLLIGTQQAAELNNWLALQKSYLTVNTPNIE